MGKKAKMFSSDDYSAADLLQVGIEHLNAALALSNNSYRYLDSAGYLCHMGIELMLKAWVLHRNGCFRATHPLKDHIEALSQAGEAIVFTERQLQVLRYISNFSELRYPSLKSPVEIGTEDMELVEEVAEAIWQQMPDDLIDAYECIPAHKKGRQVIMRRKKELPRDLELETGITAKKKDTTQ